MKIPKKKFVSVNSLTIRGEDENDHICLMFYGPRGGLRSAESLTVESADKLLKDLIEATNELSPPAPPPPPEPKLFQVAYSVPFEGKTILDFSTLDEAKTWLLDNKRNYDSLDNVDVYEVKKYVDVFELMKEPT